jgi:hypothetical protein
MLVELGAVVRDLVREQKPGQDAKHYGASEAITGDPSDPMGLGATPPGMDGGLHTGPDFTPVGRCCAPEAAERSAVRAYANAARSSAQKHPTDNPDLQSQDRQAGMRTQ